jgi:hypothetical protein
MHTTTAVPRSFSIELLLMIGLPVLTLVAGAITMALAYGQGFTPAPAAPPTALHGG